MYKKTIAVVAGGYSQEAIISRLGAKLILNNLDQQKFEAYQVVILKDQWFMINHFGQKLQINRNDFSVQIHENRKLMFDICFNMICGNPGENGEMQAYWDKVNQKYTGCSSKISALTFSKKDTLDYLSQFSIPSAKRLILTKMNMKQICIDAIINQLSLPLFVKPNASGSSIGASKVNVKEQLNAAIQLAFSQDKQIIIEKFLEGTEVSVGINRYKGKAVILGVTQIIPFGEFFDHAAKYEGQSQEITPARLDDQTLRKVEQIAINIYNYLQMTTVSRSEFIIVNGIPYFLEINTNPGFSEASIIPQQLKYMGMSIKQFCTLEIEKVNQNIKHL